MPNACRCLADALVDSHNPNIFVCARSKGTGRRQLSRCAEHKGNLGPFALLKYSQNVTKNLRIFCRYVCGHFWLSLYRRSPTGATGEARDYEELFQEFSTSQLRQLLVTIDALRRQINCIDEFGGISSVVCEGFWEVGLLIIFMEYRLWTSSLDKARNLQVVIRLNTPLGVFVNPRIFAQYELQRSLATGSRQDLRRILHGPLIVSEVAEEIITRRLSLPFDMIGSSAHRLAASYLRNVLDGIEDPARFNLNKPSESSVDDSGLWSSETTNYLISPQEGPSHLQQHQENDYDLDFVGLCSVRRLRGNVGIQHIALMLI